MAGYSAEKDRKVIPRWRTFNTTRFLGELNSHSPPQKHPQETTDFLVPKVTAWQENRSVAFASDLVGAGVALIRQEEVAEAARFLLNEDSGATVWTKELARTALKLPSDRESSRIGGATGQDKLKAQVKALRDLLRIEPYDPITWVDLSRTYACLGLREQAKRSMTIAAQLAPSNRFVVRSASRLWIHLDNPERAHDVVIDAERTRYDPWLLAAEIAIGSIANGSPKFVKDGRRMLAQGEFSSAHLSELASALATLELSSGNVKKSKRLFRQSLENPTENSVAQAAWALRQDSPTLLDDRQLGLSNTFEARSWISYQNCQWNDVVEQCKQWLFDQPFSSRPCAMGSYVAAVALEDFTTSKWFLEWGLGVNSTNVMLLNNLAFTHISLGDLEKARGLLLRTERMALSSQEQVVLRATGGLLEFRDGNLDRGRAMYSDALLRARQLPNSEGRKIFALASKYYAIEEHSLGTEDCQPMLTEALQAIKEVSDPMFRVLECRVSEMIAPKHLKVK